MARDALRALSGLAKVYSSQQPGDRYLAGLWELSIIDDLRWTCQITPGWPEPPAHPPWRAPSWSWASVYYPVVFRNNNITQNRARLVRAQVELAGPDPTGEVLSASITLSGWIAMANVIQKDDETGRSILTLLTSTGEVLPRVRLDWKFSDDVMSVGTELTMFLVCVEVLTHYHPPEYDECILLLFSIEGRAGQFARVGLRRHHRKDKRPAGFWGDGSTVAEVEIV